MVARSFQVIVLLVLFCAKAALAATPIASIDRSVISIDDTLTLTIRVDETVIFNGPDTSVLEKDFKVLGTNQNSRHTWGNGQPQSATEWFITLAPRHLGNLEIPPITVGNESTDRLTVLVRDAPVHSAMTNDPVFMESEISGDQVYVQQQLLLTVRIYVAIQLDNLSLSDIEIDQALVERLQQSSFQRRINNRIYRVHEIVYGIYPQQSGTLTIPELIFSANEISRQRSVYSLPGQGRPLRRLTKQHDIEVLPTPTEFLRKANNPWLPAQDIQLAETWSSNPDELRVGDSVTRSISLKARGLLGAQLPPIEFKPVSNARFYPDQGHVENELTAQGASAVRTDSVAIIPTAEGGLTLPAITVSWWDTDTNSIKSATLPARTLTVKPAPAGSQSTAQPLAANHSADFADTAAALPVTSPALWGWQVATAVFVCLWLATLAVLWYSRSASQSPVPAPKQPQRGESEKQAFAQLLTYCDEGNPRAIRSALVHWAKLLWPDEPIHSLYDIQARCRQKSLVKLLGELDRQLYARDTTQTAMDYRELIGLLKLMRNARTEAAGRGAPQQLPEIYRAGA